VSLPLPGITTARTDEVLMSKTHKTTRNITIFLSMIFVYSIKILLL